MTTTFTRDAEGWDGLVASLKPGDVVEVGIERLGHKATVSGELWLSGKDIRVGALYVIYNPGGGVVDGYITSIRVISRAPESDPLEGWEALKMCTGEVFVRAPFAPNGNPLWFDSRGDRWAQGVLTKHYAPLTRLVPGEVYGGEES